MQSRRRLSRDDFDDVSQFIHCVRQRPVLYNYKLSPQQRRRTEVNKCWLEIATEIRDLNLFGGGLTAGDCRKKWKNLRDTYHQYRLRKSKFRECLEKWRYTKDLEFLVDIYQPKLKCEREKYEIEHNSSRSCSMDENNTTAPPIIYVDEDDVDIKNSCEYGVEDEYDICAAKFEVVEEKSEAPYAEVFLYEDNEPSVVEQEVEKMSYHEEQDIEICEPIFEKVQPGASNNSSDELDLFFQFLKKKIQKWPTTDITGIQVEFLNAVLRKEAALSGKEEVEMTEA